MCEDATPADRSAVLLTLHKGTLNVIFGMLRMDRPFSFSCKRPRPKGVRSAL